MDNVLEERMIDLTKNRPMTERQDMLLTVGQGEGDLQGDDDKDYFDLVFYGKTGPFCVRAFWRYIKGKRRLLNEG